MAQSRLDQEQRTIVQALHTENFVQLQSILRTLDGVFDKYPMHVEWLFADVHVDGYGRPIGGQNFHNALHYRFILIWVLGIKAKMGALHIRYMHTLDIGDFGLSLLPYNMESLTGLQRICIRGNRIEYMSVTIPQLWIDWEQYQAFSASMIEKILAESTYLVWMGSKQTHSRQKALALWNTLPFALRSCVIGVVSRKEDDGCFPIPQRIASNLVFVDLAFSNSSFLHEDLMAMEKIQLLNIAHLQYPISQQTLVDILQDVPRLQFLYLDYLGLDTLSTKIGDSVQLRYLSLAGNPISTLPSSIAQCSLLRDLVVADTYIDLESIAHIPSVQKLGLRNLQSPRNKQAIAVLQKKNPALSIYRYTRAYKPERISVLWSNAMDTK